jgi:hypothetical protein
VIPHFRHHQLLNWTELRSSSVTSSLKVVNAISPSEFREVKRLALQEKKCPNNTAIAVAATLEDLLPDRIEPENLAKLYEKGASCIFNNPTDRETLLTRAGLFYYIDQNYKDAARLFAEASNIDDTFVARSLYWLYRAKREMKLNRDAALALRELRTRYPFAFHTVIAMVTGNRDPGEVLRQPDPTPLKRSQIAPEVNSLIEQVEVLHRYAFEQSAARVLDWAIADYSGTIEPEVKIYLSELKKEQGDYVSKITLRADVL